MSEKKYKLRILPMFVDDLNEITEYISESLGNTYAANKLVDDVEKAIYERLDFAESYEPFCTEKDREYPYYRIPVRNFAVYYVVIEDIMEVRRILYSRRDIHKLL